MSFPIYEPVTEVKILIRYLFTDGLTGKSRYVEDCFSNTIAQFKEFLLKYPGLSGAVGYGKNIRPDIEAKIVLRWTDKSGTSSTEFDNAKKFIQFVKERPALAKALGYAVI